MRQREGAAQGARLSFLRLLKFVVLAVLALFLAWLVIRAATVASLARKQPFLAQQLAPRDPRVVISLANIEFRARKGQISRPMLSRLTGLYNITPLPEEPLLYAGIQALHDGQRNQGGRLFDEAVRRNPRSRLGRIFLLDRDLQRGQIEKATAGIAILTRLVPQAEQVLMPELAKFAVNPATRDTLRAAIIDDRALGGALLTHLVAAGADADLILSLAGPAAKAPVDNSRPDWRVKLLTRLVAEGAIGKAHGVWSSLAGVGANLQRLYDPGFSGLPGPPPFNWAFASGSSGVAEPSGGGALEVEYYGREPAELVSQLTVLPPGRYRLSMRASGDGGPGDSSGLRWVVKCHGSNSEIASIPLSGLGQGGKAVGESFTVPASCSAQWLRLLGEPSEFSKPVSATVRDLKLQ